MHHKVLFYFLFKKKQDSAHQVTIKVKSQLKFAGRPGWAQFISNLEAQITYVVFNYVGTWHALGSRPGP